MDSMPWKVMVLAVALLASGTAAAAAAGAGAAPRPRRGATPSASRHGPPPATFAEMASASRRKTWSCADLGMPPRFQWDEFDGYCGEMSVQMAALRHGAWISEFVARQAGGGPQDGGQLLLPFLKNTWDVDGIGRNLYLAAANLKLNVEWFPSASGTSQSDALFAWIKGHIVAGHPPIIGVYISDCGSAADCWDRYDHIVPVTSYCTLGALGDPATRPDDQITIASLYAKSPAWRDLASLPAAPVWPKTANSCDWPTVWGGCVPQGTAYGVAVTGIADANGASLPVRLDVSSPREPNVPNGARPGWLKGTVTVTGLAAGKQYRLLRFDTIAALPTAGGPSAFLSAPFNSSVDFVAAGSTWKYKDPNMIKSDGVAYYRCVPLP